METAIEVAMEVAEGDERTRAMMLRKTPGRRCLHCDAEGHIHTACPKRPCYICGVKGHMSPACPHRRRPMKHLDRARASTGARTAVDSFLRASELGIRSGPPPQLPSAQLDGRVRAVLERAHERRVTALAWHPSGRIVASGDKRGNFSLARVGGDPLRAGFELETNAARLHPVIVSAIAFEADGGAVWTASIDGCVKRTPVDAEDGLAADTLLNLNPDGWTEGMTLARWRTVMAFALSGQNNGVGYAGTCKGAFHVVDRRVKGSAGEYPRMHHRAKMTSIEANPVRPQLLLSCANDKAMKLWDARKLGEGMEVGFYRHPLIPFGASFSPNSGARVVSTCHDNRVRVWRDVNALAGNANERADAHPKEIVHAHNFNRYLSPFRAAWDPKDWTDDLFLVGRYLGDSYSVQRGNRVVEKILHPVDLFSAKKADIVGSLIDIAVTTRCPLSQFSPTDDIIVSGNSFNLAFWGPRDAGAAKPRRKGEGEGAGGADGNDGEDGDGDDDDDGDGGRGARKKRKTVAVRKKKPIGNGGGKTRTRSTKMAGAR